MIFMGYATPKSTISIKIDNEETTKVEAEDDGFYKILFNTADLSFGSHTARAYQTNSDNSSNNDSPQKIFVISILINPQTDFNLDGVVDIKDFSVFLARWRSGDASIRDTIDLNRNGKIDISDFSIFIRTIK